MRTEEEIQTDIDKARKELDTTYWTFTRCKKGSPVPVTEARSKLTSLENELKQLKRTQKGIIKQYWGIILYKEYPELSEETTFFTATIIRNGKPAISVGNKGTGGANHYLPVFSDQATLQEFLNDAKDWAASNGFPNIIEPESLWIDWFVQTQINGKDSEEVFKLFKENLI